MANRKPNAFLTDTIREPAQNCPSNSDGNPNIKSANNENTLALRNFEKRAQDMEYFDPQKNWRRIRRRLEMPIVRHTLTRDFQLYTMGRWNKMFLHYNVPAEFESCDWHETTREIRGIRGPDPAYWNYVKHAACHWLVNFNLRLAEQVEPHRTWRIVSSDAHSTVWDGELTLFDFNFHALCIEPEEAFRLARDGGRVLKPGREIRVFLAEHYTVENRAFSTANGAHSP